MILLKADHNNNYTPLACVFCTFSTTFFRIMMKVVLLECSSWIHTSNFKLKHLSLLIGFTLTFMTECKSPNFMVNSLNLLHMVCPGGQFWGHCASHCMFTGNRPLVEYIIVLLSLYVMHDIVYKFMNKDM